MWWITLSIVLLFSSIAPTHAQEYHVTIWPQDFPQEDAGGVVVELRAETGFVGSVSILFPAEPLVVNKIEVPFRTAVWGTAPGGKILGNLKLEEARYPFDGSTPRVWAGSAVWFITAGDGKTFAAAKFRYALLDKLQHAGVSAVLIVVRVNFLDSERSFSDVELITIKDILALRSNPPSGEPPPEPEKKNLPEREGVKKKVSF